MKKLIIFVGLLALAMGIKAQNLYVCPNCSSLRHTPTDQLKSMAEKGDAAAMTRLAFRYMDGAMGVEQDSAAAYNLIEKASNAGYEEATLSLSYFYLEGSIVKADTNKTYQLRKTLADKGNAAATALLSYCYLDGHGVPIDTVQATALAKKAVNVPDAYAYYVIGSAYEDGWGDFKRDIDKALDNYRLAYKLGIDKAALMIVNILNYEKEDYKTALSRIEEFRYLNRVGICAIEIYMYNHGEGVKADISKAREIARRNIATHPQDYSALSTLSETYVFPNDPAERNIDSAIAILAPGVAHNDTRCLNDMGCINFLFGEKGEPDSKKAIEYFQRSLDIDPNDVYANYLMGEILINGSVKDSIPADRAKAETCYKAAYKYRHSGAALALGDIYQYSNDYVDIPLAMKYYRDAAEWGNTDAYTHACELFTHAPIPDSIKAYAQQAIAHKNDNGYYWLAVGEDMTGNAKNAIKAIQKGAKTNNVLCLLTLGDCYANGTYVKAAPKKAVQYYEQVGKLGDSRGYYKAGRLYVSGGVEGATSAALYKGIEYLHLAAEMGNADAIYTLGVIYEVEQYGLRDYEKALSYFQELADHDNPDGLFKVGLFYELGDGGLEQDSAKAVEYYQRAADMGNAIAMCYLADFYRAGKYLPLDEEKAYELYQRAAEMGNSDGCFGVGKCLLVGSAVPADTIMAVKYIRQSALMGNGQACALMGKIFEEGNILSKDMDSAIYYYHMGSKSDDPICDYEMGLYLSHFNLYDKAAEYFYSAASHGNPKAAVELALLYKNGMGVKQNIETYQKLLHLAAENQCPEAYVELGIATMSGIGCIEDHPLAKRYFDTAANMGNAVAMYDLYICYRNGDGCNTDTAQAIQWLRRGAAQGHTYSINELGNIYESGTSLPVDYDSAFYYYNMGYELNSVLSAYSLACCYEMGHGCEIDMKKALEFFTIAADNGNASAQYKVGTIYQYGEEGIEPNLEMAQQYYKLASDQGFAPATAALENMKSNKKSKK